MELEVIVLAAGKGTRMYSDIPKVLHRIGGKSMLAHVVDAAAKLKATKTHLVTGYQGDLVRQSFAADSTLNWVEQAEQLGTGHAVMQVLPHLQKNSTVLILYGDVPLLKTGTLLLLLEKTRNAAVAVLTLITETPHGQGRIVRDANGSATAIVEEKDADAEQQKISEINSGIIAVSAAHLSRWLARLTTGNAQGEYYLTDIIALAHSDGEAIETLVIEDSFQVQGVNNRLQLAELERHYQIERAKNIALQGVTLADPQRLDIRGEPEFGKDVEIDINVILEGKVKVGNRVKIGANVIIRNSTIGDGSTILPNSIVEDAQIKSDCSVGPFARIRPGTILEDKAKIGNFVETKKALIGKGSKVSHLSYIGDATLGENVNVGAGTITCNYDGVNKFQTEISDGVFVGSNTALVAPVKIGEQATIAAGSTITGNVPAKSLAVARGRQRNIEGWQRPLKKQD
jgi:bifunctional UDP-N-acetylglucosamine pyrophosphorylase / glucosamine-1-phosphate N-acetyltransferase